MKQQAKELKIKSPIEKEKLKENIFKECTLAYNLK
jgi:hypothetical protein